MRYEQDAAWRMLNQQQVSKYPSDGRGRTRRGSWPGQYLHRHWHADLDLGEACHKITIWTQLFQTTMAWNRSFYPRKRSKMEYWNSYQLPAALPFWGILIKTFLDSMAQRLCGSTSAWLPKLRARLLFSAAVGPISMGHLLRKSICAAVFPNNTLSHIRLKSK